MSNSHKKHFQKYYSLPFLEIGVKVFYKPKNKFGKIAHFGNHLHIKLDDETKSLKVHPTESISYFDKNNVLLKDFE